ncbi:unnamed protein product, partial [Dovyalis caffra]
MCRNLSDDIHCGTPIIPLMRKTSEVDVLRGVVQMISKVDEVPTTLTHSLASQTLHGGISQHERERSLNDFGRGKFNVDLATDVAFRGLDIPNVDLCFQLELFPKLEKLSIWICKNVESLSLGAGPLGDFTSLHSLSIYDFSSLVIGLQKIEVPSREYAFGIAVKLVPFQKGVCPPNYDHLRFADCNKSAQAACNGICNQSLLLVSEILNYK